VCETTSPLLALQKNGLVDVFKTTNSRMPLSTGSTLTRAGLLCRGVKGDV